MSRYSFTPARTTDWLNIGQVEAILGGTRADILRLVESGTLRARSLSGVLYVDADSVDAYAATRPARRPEPDVFVKVNGLAYREVRGQLRPL